MNSHSIWDGHLVRLRAIEAGDWRRFHENDADSDAARLGYWVPFSRDTQAALQWAEEQSRPKDGSDDFRWAIEALEGGALLGSINTHGCDSRNGTFEYGLGIFREHWGKGYARDAIMILFRYYFDELRYEKANATAYAFNEPSQRLHEKLGFTLEGRIRSNVYAAGERHDELWYGMTAAEFRALDSSE
jgi:RimJ/RimL family protein N-acetyltransferase